MSGVSVPSFVIVVYSEGFSGAFFENYNSSVDTWRAFHLHFNFARRRGAVLHRNLIVSST